MIVHSMEQTSGMILKASNLSWDSSLERRYENHQHHFTSKNPKWSFGSRSEPEVEHVIFDVQFNDYLRFL